MWEFIGGVIGGVVTGVGLTLLEPVQRRLATLSRKALSDHGIQSHIELDPNVIYAGWPDWVGFHYYLPDTWDRAAPPSNPRAWREWAQKNGGWDLQQSEVRVTLTGTSPVSVVIETPIVDVSERPLPPGRKVLHAVGGAEASPRGFDVQLDTQGAANPWVEFTDDSGELHSEPLVWTLAQGQIEVFRIRVRSSRPALYSWRARIPVIVHGERYFIAVDYGGASITFAGGEIDDFLRWDGASWVGSEA